MTIAFWCVLAAGILPYVATVISKAGVKDYDNREPRAGLDQLQGYRARANAAQLNSFEAFPLFAAAVIIARIAHGPQHIVDVFALIFVAARIVYLACYLAKLGTLRSLVWGVGFFCVIGIFVAAAT